MIRRLGLCLAVLGVLVAAPAAYGGFAAPYAAQGQPGILSNDGALRFVALDAGPTTTVLSAIKTSDGTPWKSSNVSGAFGIPMLTPTGLSGGLFRDGTTLVLQSVGATSPTRFMLVSTNDLAPRDSISLSGVFAFDALSPDGTKLYLTQHTSANDLQHYVVRVYDLAKHRLLPGRIADRTQKSWIMQGYAANRTSTTTGRWVYTLYANPGGIPFVHALDTVKGKARCIGIPWPAGDRDQSPVYNLALAVKGTKLSVDWKSGRKFMSVDLKTWKVTKAKPGLQRSWIGAGGGLVLLGGAGLALLRRSRRREKVLEQTADGAGLPERQIVV